MEAAHDETTSKEVYAVLTGWWWDRHEHDGPPQDGALLDGGQAATITWAILKTIQTTTKPPNQSSFLFFDSLFICFI